MSNNPESYARLPVTKLASMIDGLYKRIVRVSHANTLNKLIRYYEVYRKSFMLRLRVRLFGGTPLDFHAWVKERKQEHRNAGIFDTTIFWRCFDDRTYATLIGNMENLVKYSDEYALLADTDLACLTDAIAKGEKLKEADEYLAKMEAEYPGIYDTLTKND